jgi:putative cell wall-binding protein
MKKRLPLIPLALIAACVALAMLPTVALAMPRDAALDRGNVWVNKYQKTDSKGNKIYGVPYSQSRWAYEDGSLIPTSTSSASTKGYRTDCSGFASLCWGLKDSSGRPYSSTTAEMGAKGSKRFFQIKKADLQPGDAMLKSTVWGASVGHVIIFCGWVDSSQKSYWCMEQTTTSKHNGTIYHTRPYGESYYRPYRYSGIEEAYTDVLDSIRGKDAFAAAISAADTAFPTPKTGGIRGLVVVNAGQWRDQVTAAAIAGSLGGPVLLTSAKSLPASTTAEIKRLKPGQIFVLGSNSTISTGVAGQLASLTPSVVRINGSTGFNVAAAAVSFALTQSKATTHPADTVYVVSGDTRDEALAIAPVAARSGRPVVYVHTSSVPSVVVSKLRAAKIKRVIIVGRTKVVSSSVEKLLRKRGFKVSRISGIDRYKTSVAIAKHAIGLKLGFTWSRMGVTAPDSTTDALAWGAAVGQQGSLLTLTSAKKLDAAVRRTAAANRTQIVKARVFGGSAVSYGARKALAKALRSGK